MEIFGDGFGADASALCVITGPSRENAAAHLSANQASAATKKGCLR
jgi:hypothetical protein